MLKAMVVSDADPQNPFQAPIVRGFQPVALCLCQRPHLTTIDEVWNDKRAKNLHLGLHQKVAIPPHLKELCKNAQPTCMASINLLLQASLGDDDASHIFEKLH